VQRSGKEQDIKWGSLKVKRTRAPEEHTGAPSVRVCDHLMEEMDMARGAPPDHR
jgi:hypothetical protein